MSVRIIAGLRRGAILRTPPGDETRPTLGRVRTSIFGIMQAQIPGANVLDLFAGSGSLGLESLSRGAAGAAFIEQAAPALAALRANIAKLRWEGLAHVVPGEVLTVLRRAAHPLSNPIDLVLLDPPYGHGLCAKALTLLGAEACVGAWLAPGAWVVAQVGRKDSLDPDYGALHRFREEGYGQTRVAFYRLGD